MDSEITELVTGSAPGLKYRFTIEARTDPALSLEARSAEELVFIPITGGPVHGAIEGRVVSGGGDWCLRRSDDASRVEARYGIQTTDGHYIDVHNIGILRHLEGESGGPMLKRYFMTSPEFRTRAPELQWLTRSLFVGKSRVLAGNTTIDVYEVVVD